MIILSISFLVACIGAIVVMYWFPPKTAEKLNYGTKVMSVALVCLGFSLTWTVDVIKQTLTERKERAGIVKMLQFELAEMHATIISNLKAIPPNPVQTNTVATNTRPLLLLNTAAWETAKLKHSIFVTNTGDLFKLVNLYTATHVANEKIRARENYRLYNQAMTDHQEKLNAIDADIRQTLEKTMRFHSIAQQFLHSQYPFTIEGYSFSFDDGVVRKEK